MDGSVVVDESGITLHFKKLMAHADKKAASPVHVPWQSVASVTFTESRGMTPGFLRVHAVGAPATVTQPKRDPYVLLANGTRQCANVRLVAEQASYRLARRAGVAPVSDHVGAQRGSVRDASDRMTLKLGSRRELRKLAKHHLLPGEQVRYAASGRVQRRLGLVALTDRRLVFLFHGMVRQAVEDLPLDNITSVREKGGLVFGTLTVLASSTELVISEVPKADMKALASALRARMSTGSLPPLPPLDLTDTTDDGEPPSAPLSDQDADVLAQLRQLGELKESGVLTGAEFEAAKADLLRRL